ncbi:MAG: hypothetical protein IJ849_03320 [Selenomonadaceae bacterium]|nr:hypothetical protein [Selenomonadaceae bacterium]
MENTQALLWELEGELLEATMAGDKLRKKNSLNPEEREKLADIEKRREILTKRLRKIRMGG